MKNILLAAFIIILTNCLSAQAPNRTFGNFKKSKEVPTALSCTDNCVTIKIAYEKGTYINSIKAAIGIDDDYVIGLDKGTYIEIQIPAGEHKFIMPQGMYNDESDNDAELCESNFDGLQSICAKFDKLEYQILLSEEISELQFNLKDNPYTTKLFSGQINYLTYNRNIAPGTVICFKTIRLGNGTSLSCGPIVTETTEADFTSVIKDKNIKEKGDACFFLNSEK